jgi:hypothetical protein
MSRGEVEWLGMISEDLFFKKEGKSNNHIREERRKVKALKNTLL